MFLEDYIKNEKKILLSDFLELTEEEAISFDFLSQGDEADRTDLTNEIYREIFPWFDKDNHAGDTLCTYRTAIKKYYGKYYPSLDEETQNQIIRVIDRHTSGNPLLEFNYFSDDKNKRNSICNNYQLGNFGILPKKGGINPLRAKAPYFDYFDSFIYVLNDYYNDELDCTDDKLKEAIFLNKDYFDKFSNIDGFLEENYLMDFFYLVESEDVDPYYNIIDLSSLESFEEYVKTTTSLIKKRGERIYDVLKNSWLENENTSDSIEPLNSKIMNAIVDISHITDIEHHAERDFRSKEKESKEAKHYFDYIRLRWYLLPFPFVWIIRGVIIPNFTRKIYESEGDFVLANAIQSFSWLTYLIVVVTWYFLIRHSLSTKKNENENRAFADKILKDAEIERDKTLTELYESPEYETYKQWKGIFPSDLFNSRDLASMYILLKNESIDSLDKLYYLRRINLAKENEENNRLLKQWEADETAVEQNRLIEEHSKELKRYNDQKEEDKRRYGY